MFASNSDFGKRCDSRYLYENSPDDDNNVYEKIMKSSLVS